MKIYPSKVSPLLVLILLVPIVLSSYEMLSTKNYENWWALPLIFIPIYILIFSIRYLITDTTLVIKIAGFKYLAISIKDITSIRHTNNPLSSPAAGFKRLDICYGAYGNVLVSPKDKEKFIADLQAINPNIVIKN